MKRFKIFLLNGLILTATSFLMRSIGFSFGIYISKKVGSEALGVFSLIMSVYMFFITFATSGINLAVTRIIVEKTTFCENANTKLAMRKCFIYSLTFGVASCILLIALAKPITYYFVHNRVSHYLFYFIAISLPFISLSSALNGYFTALRKNGKNATSRIFEQTLKMLATSYFLSLFMPSGIYYACLSLVLGEMISEIGSFFFTYILYKLETRKHLVKQKENINYFKKILSISLPVAITSYIRSGLSSLKQLLIPIRLEKSGLTCNEAISSYGLISGMTMPILMFPEVIINSFSNLVVPEYAYYDTKKVHSKITYTTEKIFRITFLFSIGVLGIFLFYNKEISYAIYQNFNIANFLKTLAPLIFFMYLDGIIDNILKGLNQQLDVMKCNILDLFTSVFFIYFLLPVFGLNGYIMIIYFSELLNFSISFYQLKKLTHFKIDFINWLIKPILGIVFSFILCKFLVPNIVLNTTSIVLQIVMFVFGYFVFLLISKSITT